jgi:hypothetical protein
MTKQTEAERLFASFQVRFCLCGEVEYEASVLLPALALMGYHQVLPDLRLPSYAAALVA